MRKVCASAAAVVAGYGIMHRLGRTFGSTAAERRRVLPGDEIVPHPNFTTTHAVTIDAPPSAVWPWLVQMGWHQGGFYTSPWVDRLLFPANEPAVDHIIPELQGRRVGDFVPDGPPEAECGYTIVRLDPEHCLVLHSTSHLPMSWRRHGAQLEWTWTFVLDDLGDGQTRFVFRCRGVAQPFWVYASYQLAIVPADFVMSTQMMRGVKERAERLATERSLAAARSAGVAAR
jgi:hypothetical protein